MNRYPRHSDWVCGTSPSLFKACATPVNSNWRGDLCITEWIKICQFRLFKFIRKSHFQFKLYQFNFQHGLKLNHQLFAGDVFHALEPAHDTPSDSCTTCTMCVNPESRQPSCPATLCFRRLTSCIEYFEIPRALNFDLLGVQTRVRVG